MSTEHLTDIPEGYKMTELGLLPEEWEVVRLGDVVKLRKETINPSEGNSLKYVGLEHLESGTLIIKKHGNPSEVKSTKYRYYPNDLLYGKLRPYLDKAALAEEEGMCSTDILVFQTEKKINSYFFGSYLHLPSFIKYSVSTMTGVNHPRTSWNALKKYQIPLPPFPEQRAIAHVLQTVQDAKEKIEGVIQAAKELKKSLLKYLFSYGPVPVEDAEKVPLKKTEVGLIPEEWQVVRLGEVAERPTYGLTTTATSSLTPYKLLRISDIQDGRINWENVPFCEFDEPPKEKYILKKNDIVIARIGATTGKAIQYKKGPITLFASYLIRIRTKQPLESNFLINFFCTDFYWKQINEQKGGRLKKGVNIPIINNLLITLPSLHIQQRIADILSTVDERIESAENKKHALETLFKTLLSRLMSGKIRVNRSHGLVNEVEYEKG